MADINEILENAEETQNSELPQGTGESVEVDETVINGEETSSEENGENTNTVGAVFIVENGTGLTDANSYVDIDFVDSYFSSRGNNEWLSLEESAKKILAVKATDYIDNLFNWYGRKATQEQSLNFPRTNLFDTNGYEVIGIPKQIKEAVCEACLIATASELFSVANENGAVISETIGSLSFTYDLSKKVDSVSLYDSINKRLRGLFRDNTKNKVYSVKVSRV